MRQQDNYIPRNNLRTSLFGEQLPENSTYLGKSNVKNINNIQNKYQQNDNDGYEDEIRFTMGQLKQESNVIKKKNDLTSSNQKSTQQQLRISNWGDLQIESNIIAPHKIEPMNSHISFKPSGFNKSRRHSKKTQNAKTNKNQQIDIDQGIGQVAQWAEKGTKLNKDSENQSDENEQPAEQNTNQQQIKRRLNQKIKNMQKGNQKKQQSGPIGLKAKAQQLRLKNSQKKQQNSLEIAQRSQQQLKNVKNNLRIQEQPEQEDPWDEINKKTLQQKQKTKQLRKQLDYQTVMKHFQNLSMKFEQQQQQQQPQNNSSGCLASLCICFTQKPMKLTICQKQSIGLSKQQLGNSQEQFYILKQIWVNITKEKFNRYGSHWNKIGFQGRDPATDLRSTGILSLVQWFEFLQNHQNFYQKVFKYSLQFQIPLALTHIKITSKILQMTKHRIIQSRTWQQLFSYYNSFAFTFFDNILKKQLKDENIGETIDINIETLSKNATKTLRLYLRCKQQGKINKKN